MLLLLQKLLLLLLWIHSLLLLMLRVHPSRAWLLLLLLLLMHGRAWPCNLHVYARLTRLLDILHARLWSRLLLLGVHMRLLNLDWLASSIHDNTDVRSPRLTRLLHLHLHLRLTLHLSGRGTVDSIRWSALRVARRQAAIARQSSV